MAITQYSLQLTDYTDTATGEVTPGLLTYCREMVEALAPIYAIAVGVWAGTWLAHSVFMAARLREIQRGWYLFGGAEEEE